jgi:hypothetical protein
MAIFPHSLPAGLRAQSLTPHRRKISIPLINNPPGKYCLVHLVRATRANLARQLLP